MNLYMILKIKKSGYSFELPRYGLIKTPCELKISTTDINSVITSLRMNGISSYQIIVDDEKTVKVNKNITRVVKAYKPKPETIVYVETEPIIKNIPIDKITTKIDILLNKLENLNSNPNINIEESKSQNPKIEELIDDEEFIPEIDFGGLEITSKTNEMDMLIDDDDDIEDTVNILRELKKGNK